jgi:hypothetical protein
MANKNKASLIDKVTSQTKKITSEVMTVFKSVDWRGMIGKKNPDEKPAAGPGMKKIQTKLEGVKKKISDLKNKPTTRKKTNDSKTRK